MIGAVDVTSPKVSHASPYKAARPGCRTLAAAGVPTVRPARILRTLDHDHIGQILDAVADCPEGLAPLRECLVDDDQPVPLAFDGRTRRSASSRRMSSAASGLYRSGRTTGFEGRRRFLPQHGDVVVDPRGRDRLARGQGLLDIASLSATRPCVLPPFAPPRHGTPVGRRDSGGRVMKMRISQQELPARTAPAAQQNELVAAACRDIRPEESAPMTSTATAVTASHSSSSRGSPPRVH